MNVNANVNAAVKETREPRAFPGLLRIETRRGVALLLSPFILAAAWWMAWYGTYGSMIEPGFSGAYIWEETSRVVKDSILTTGPLAAGIAAWVAGRNRRRGVGDLLSTTALPGARRELFTWTGAALPFVGIYLGLVVLLGVPTAINATWGTPIFGYILVGLVALLWDSALGFAAGYWLPSRFTAPLVAVALYVAHLLPMGASDYDSGVGLLSPAAYSNMSGADVFHEAPPIAAQQIMLFGGLAAAALASVAVRAGARRAGRISLTVALPVAAGGLVAALMSGNPYGFNAAEAEPVPFEYVCEGGGITVCVHPAYSKLLPETTTAVNRVAEPLVGVIGAPTRAVQIDHYMTPKDFEKGTATFGYVGDEAKFDVAYSLVADEATMEELASTGKEEGFTKEDVRVCGGSPPRRFFSPSYEAQSVVGDWLLARSGGKLPPRGSTGDCPNAEDLIEGFAALDPAERRAWLDENLADLRAGRVSLDDLP